MKTLKFTKSFIALVAAVILTTASCKKHDDTIVTPHEDAYGDVILKKMSMMGQIKYVPIFFAGGEGITEESTVTAPDGTVYPLHSFWAGPGILTGKGQMKDVFDFAGEYTFHLKFSDGYEKEVTDVLENVEIDIPHIVQFTRSTPPEAITVTWTPVEGADLYCIKITELDMANTKPLFKIPQISKSRNSFTVVFDGGDGWMRPVSDMERGTEYYFVVAAKKVEEGAEVSGKSHDFQTSSCTKIKFIY